MPSLIDIRTRWASGCIVLNFTVVGLFSAGCVTAAEDSQAFDKTAERSVDMPTDKIAEQDVPNTAESKQKHVYLVRNVIMGSSRYKQYSDADKINVRILLDGLEPMAVKFYKPAAVAGSVLGNFEYYSCAVTEVLRRYEDIQNLPKNEASNLRLGRDLVGMDDGLNVSALRKILPASRDLSRLPAPSFQEKRESIKTYPLGKLYQILKRSKDGLTGYCSDESVELLGRSLCKSASTNDVSLEKAFENLHRAEQLLKDRYGGPVFDDHRRILH